MHFKENKKLNSKTNNLNKKLSKQMNRSFSKDGIEWPTDMKNFLGLTNNRKNANKNHNKISFHPRKKLKTDNKC